MGDQADLHSQDIIWRQYIDAVRRNTRRPTTVRWYLLRTEAYLKHYADKPLAAHEADDVVQWLTDLDRRAGIEDRQFRQTIEALRILFVEVLRSDWAADFDWQYRRG